MNCPVCGAEYSVMYVVENAKLHFHVEGVSDDGVEVAFELPSIVNRDECKTCVECVACGTRMQEWELVDRMRK